MLTGVEIANALTGPELTTTFFVALVILPATVTVCGPDVRNCTMNVAKPLLNVRLIGNTANESELEIRYKYNNSLQIFFKIYLVKSAIPLNVVAVLPYASRAVTATLLFTPAVAIGAITITK